MKVRVRVQQRDRANDDTSIEKKKQTNPADPQSTSFTTIKDLTNININMSTPTCPAPDQTKGATIAANTIDSSASAEMLEDESGSAGNDVLPTPQQTTVAKQDKGKQAIVPVPGAGNTAMTTLPGANAKALHTTIPGAGAARPQRSNYAEPADWSKPTPTPTTTTSTTTALAPAPPAPGPVLGSAAGVAASNAPSSSNQKQQQQQQQHHHPHPPPPPPSNAAHLPKTTPQSKGPYYIPQSAPAAATGTVETGVASSSAASAATSIPIATNQTSTMATPGLAPGRYVELSGVQGQGQGIGLAGPSGGLPGPATASGQRYAVNTAYGAVPPAAGGMLRREVGEAGLDGELNEAAIEKQPWWTQAWDATKEMGKKIGNGLAKLDDDFWRWQNSRS